MDIYVCRKETFLQDDIFFILQPPNLVCIYTFHFDAVCKIYFTSSRYINSLIIRIDVLALWNPYTNIHIYSYSQSIFQQIHIDDLRSLFANQKHIRSNYIYIRRVCIHWNESSRTQITQRRDCFNFNWILNQ